MRYGLNLLWKAGKIAESQELSQVNKFCVDLANKDLCPPHFHEILGLMPKEKLLLLLAIVKLSTSINNKHITIKKVYTLYNQLCILQKLPPKSYSQIWNYVQEYKKDNLLGVKIQSKNIKGRKSILEIQNISLPILEHEIIESLHYKGVIYESNCY